MRKLLSLAAVAAVALAALPAFAAAPPPETLRAYAQRAEARHAYGIYVAKKKAGWMVVERKLGKHGGKDVLVHTEEAHLVQTFGGTRKVAKEKKITAYSLEGEGAVLFQEEQKGQDSTSTLRRAVRTDRGMMLTIKKGGRTTERLVAFPKDSLAQDRKLAAWLRTARKGDTFVSWSTDWDGPDVNLQTTLTFQEKKSAVWRGRQVPVYACVLLAKGLRSDVEVLENGIPFSTSLLGGLLTIRMEEEAVARQVGGGADVAASFIALDRDLGRSGRDVRKLTLEVKGLGDLSLPRSHRQRVWAGNGGAIVELQPDFRVAKGAPLTQAEKAMHTKATPRIQADNEAIRKLAQKIVGAEKDPLKKATLLSKWVHNNLRYDFRHAWASDALAILDNRSGVCADFALLYVALARSMGLPAREVSGLVYINPREPRLAWKRYWWGSLPYVEVVSKPQLGWHAWVEVHDGSQWVSLDPTMDLVRVGATHITFGADEDQAWKNVMGQLSIRVVAVEKASRAVAAR
jgi:hypothetical protein